MIKQGLQAEIAAFVASLKACSTQKDLYRGISLHAVIVKKGLSGQSSYLANTLISMYAKCGALSRARHTLHEISTRDVVSWSALIAGYAQLGQGHHALHCFEQMQREGASPNAVTFCSILKGCGSVRAADKGKQIHDEISKQEFLHNNPVLGNALMDMYAKCGILSRARQVLQALSTRDIVSWNTLIAGYAHQGQGHDALNCLDQMCCEGFFPNAVTFICALKACACAHAVNRGAQIHVEIIRQRLLDSDIVLGNTLVDMYAKCGTLAKAEDVLRRLHIRDAISWNAIIAGYTQQNKGREALDCYEQMQSEGLSPDVVTFLQILRACGRIGAVTEGERVHEEVVRKGLLESNIALGTALVDMYAKCGSFVKARHVLEQSSLRDVVSWNALIAGYVQKGLSEQALDCFEKMQQVGMCPDEVTFTCVLKAYGSIGAIDRGKQVHDEIVRQGFSGCDKMLGTALVAMYAKCGALAKAEQLLDELPFQDIVTWCALASGYAQQGLTRDALHCLKRMQGSGLSPNAVALSSMLYACSHSGLVDEGRMYFANLSSKIGIIPDYEHYASIVDLLGRAGHFYEAITWIQKMPSSNNLAAWSALMGACKKWGNVDVGRWAFDHAVQIDRSDFAAYVCMARIYTVAGMHGHAKAIEFMASEVMHVSQNTVNKGFASMGVNVVSRDLRPHRKP